MYLLHLFYYYFLNICLNYYFLDVFCEEDFGDSINLSRRKAHIKFVDRSLHDTTSTPIKSPCNSVSKQNFLNCIMLKKLFQTIVNFILF